MLNNGRGGFVAGDQVEAHLPTGMLGQSSTGAEYDQYFADRPEPENQYSQQVNDIIKIDITKGSTLLEIDDLGMTNHIAQNLTAGVIFDGDDDAGWLFDHRWPVDFSKLTSKFRSMFAPAPKRGIFKRQIE